MNNRPSGNVTFLFTDIEGSTKIAQEFHNTHAETFRKHRDILSEAFESCNGFVFKIIGDAFCCVFKDTNDAVKAAAEAQKKLNAEDWNDAIIKVRMGIHSGNAEWSGNDYMGYITLARTSRVMSAAYGEQVIISNDAYELYLNKNDLSDISFRDLGERRLKDLIQPMKLFQVIADGLRTDFPPLQTLDARPNNLPVQLTNFIGREKEMRDLKVILSGTKLLTLLGPGGTGKTRLSLQVGADVIDDFANGVWVVELASLQDNFHLPQAIAETLGLKEQPGVSLENDIIDFLRDKELLLILDNCEHIIAACAHLTEKLLQKSQKLKIIATSREALRCGGEQVHRVLSLEHPDPAVVVTAGQMMQYEAVRLFIERALAVNPHFRINDQNAPALAQICFQLDGIPLAIELAAVRIKVLSLEKICEKLNDRFKLLTGGKRTALPRQQTLRAMIEWSHNLLAEKEKILWRRLSVFTGGWKLESAEEVCTDEDLSSEDILDLTNELVEKSIILFIEKEDKYKILETIRQYGEERLIEAGEKEKIFNSYLKYYINLCESAMTEMGGEKSKFWLDKFENDYPNIQSALKWSVEMNLPEEGTRLALTMGKLWDLRGYLSEGKNWLEKLIQISDKISPALIADSKRLLGVFLTQMGDKPNSRKNIEEALEIYRKLEDQKGIANCLNVLGLNHFDLLELAEAKKCLNESLQIRRETKEEMGICSTLNSLGLVTMMEGDYLNAKKCFEEALEIAKAMKDEMYIAIEYNNLAQLYATQGNLEKAKEYFENGLETDRRMGNKNGACISLSNMGSIVLGEKNYADAKNFFNESLALSRETGFRQGSLFALVGMGQTEQAEGDLTKAEFFFKECIIELKTLEDIQCIALSMLGIAEIILPAGKYELSAMLLGVSRSKYESSGAFMEKEMQDVIEKIRKEIIKILGEEKTTEAIERGKAMSFQKAADLVLSENYYE